MSSISRSADAWRQDTGSGPHPKASQAPKEYTILLGQRPNMNPRLNHVEADAMERKGFRFAVFNHSTGEYRLSLPFVELVNLVKGTLTFRQD